MDRFKFVKTVTPNDGADNILNAQSSPQACESRIILCAVGGTISFKDGNNDTVSFTAIANILYPISTRRILSTGTAATGITALW